jgi:hypothetical protein
MRPKGSDRNKQIAVLFSDIVSLNVMCDGDIPCIGPRSLFSIFSLCFPSCTRDGKDVNPEHRDGISMIEMNKSLMSTGYIHYRKREEMSGEYKRGVRRWRSRRWVDFSSNREMIFVANKLSELHSLFTETRFLTAHGLSSIFFNAMAITDSVVDEPLQDMDLDRDCISYVNINPASNIGSSFQSIVGHANTGQTSCQFNIDSMSSNIRPSHQVFESLNSTVLRCNSLILQLMLRNSLMGVYDHTPFPLNL